MAKSETIELPKLDRRMLQVVLIGDTPLICNRFSEKAKQMILHKQMKRATTGQKPKDPDQQFRDSLYTIDEHKGVYGFPAVGFKAAAVTAANDAGIPMTIARRSFRISGQYLNAEGEDLVIILSHEGPEAITGEETSNGFMPAQPEMRFDMVRLSGPGRSADIRFRGMFRKWKAVINVEYNASVISAEQVVNLFQLAGFGVGIGEWRPEKAKSGVYGLWHVETQEDRQNGNG